MIKAALETMPHPDLQQSEHLRAKAVLRWPLPCGFCVCNKEI